MKLVIASCLFCVLLFSQVSAPNVGSARFAGRVFAVHGISANLLVARTPWTSASAVSFSDEGGLVSQGGNITLVGKDGTALATDTSSEPAPILNVDGPLSSAVAWLPSRHVLLHWNGSAFIAQDVQGDSSFAGEVTCVQLVSPNRARLLVTHADSSVSAVTVSLETGEVVSSDLLPAVRGRAFAQHSFLISEDKQGLVVESPNGMCRTVALAQDSLPAGDLTIERMSTDWLHISSAGTGRHWALYLDQTNLQLSVLPQPALQGSVQ